MACAVLATDPSLRSGPQSSTLWSTMSGLDAETERRRAQLANACRLLEKAGERSPMALGMLRRLVGVLRKHRVHGVEKDKGEVGREDNRGDGAAAAQDGGASGGGPSVPAQGSQNMGELQNLPDASSSFVDQRQEGVGGGGWAYDVAADPNALAGIWNDFLGTNPTTDGWEQLFSELDYLGGGM